MMRVVGINDIDELFESIPSEVRLNLPLDIPAALSEMELDRLMRRLAGRNANTASTRCFLGGGAYMHHVPVAVDATTSRSEFATAYTPYQPEASQGTLQSIFEFQTMVAMLTGMEVANASMYDGAEALAEAALMCLRMSRGRRRIVLARSVHPEYRETLNTYLAYQNAGVDEIDYDRATGRLDVKALESALGDDVAAVVVQSPNFFGVVEDIRSISSACSRSGAPLVGVVSEPLAWVVLTPPGELGAAVACGELQSFGMYPSFGGPGCGFLAGRMEDVRNMPGRLIGETVDAEGERGYCLTLATREQHIRRGRATSNICTNQSLMALRAAVYMSLMGKGGLRRLAVINLSLAEYAKSMLDKKASLKFKAPTFNEFVVRVGGNAQQTLDKLKEKGIIAGLPLGRWYPELNDCVLVCVTELNTREDIDELAGNWPD